MGLNRRLSLRTSYHNPFASPERFVRSILFAIHSHGISFSGGLAPYLLPLPPMSMGPHADEHPKRARYPMSLPLSVDVKKVS